VREYDDQYYSLNVINKNNELEYFTDISEPENKIYLIPKSENFKKNDIVEFEWNSENKKFLPIRIRNDKIKPNFIEVARNIWNEIVNPITEKEFLTLFKKPKKIDRNTILDINKSTIISISDENLPQIKNMVRTGTISDGSCMIHSILYSISSKYRNSTIEERIKFVTVVRNNMADLLTYEKWNQLGNGEICNFEIQKYFRLNINLFYEFIKFGEEQEDSSIFSDFVNLKKEYRKIFKNIGSEKIDSIILGINNTTNINTSFSSNKLLNYLLKHIFIYSKNKAYSEFIESIRNPSEWLSYRMLDYISDYFDKNIKFIHSKTKKLYNLGDNNSGDKKRRTLFLYYIDNTHFESMGELLEDNKVRRQFDNL
jgi:hypothetical protein